MLHMDTYLVGGAVRDQLLGLSPGDRDWVVVGATPQRMLDAGFKAVGRDFPVFLHPDTGEEHALARTERKSGRGHRGFVVDADPSVTLEEDLQRRDFTINAIARDAHGDLVDPYGGVDDIQGARAAARRPGLRRGPAARAACRPLHGPLRAAWFHGRTGDPGADAADGRQRRTGHAGARAGLAGAAQGAGRAPAVGVPTTMHGCGALAAILPEVDALYGVPQRAEFHPEVDTGTHQQLVSDMAAQLAHGDDPVGFAALTHDLGKALTPAHVLPKHIGHEHAGLKPLAALCERLKVPLEHRHLAECVCREHLNVHRALAELRDATVLELLERCDAFRRPERVARIATACEADKRGRLGSEDAEYPQGAELGRLHAAALAVNARDLGSREGLTGPQIGEAVRKARITAIGKARTLRRVPDTGP